MDPLETASLVHRAARGDPAAWETLVGAYATLVWAVARAHRLGTADAEDVCQTTWEKFARSLGTLSDPGRAGAWLSTTARRESLRVLVARNRTPPAGDMAWIGAAREDESPEEIVVAADERLHRDELATRLWEGLNRLGDGCQRLLRVMMAEPAPSYAEAAAALDVSIGYRGPTRRRCLEKLRRLVSGNAEQAHDR
ncbi:MAG TPA: sigma-70 family RNA polymerase sigma factor [Actinoplanes sp.]|nr:sigma-70 family RNA polymerase sigma factor [Actinoplanes sp.]